MLRISKLADYGTVVMVSIAREGPMFRNAKEIAQTVQLSLPTVSKCLKLLTNAGLLSSQMGAKGGYTLARPPVDISVADILAAVDGSSGLTECTHHRGDCELEPVCAISTNWRIISHAVFSALESVSLADLMQPAMSVTAINVKDITHLKSKREHHE